MNGSEASSSRDPVERLAESFLERYRRGERPSLTEYIEAHPDLADDIRDLFPALAEMEGLKSDDELVNRNPGAVARALQGIPPQLGEYRLVRMIGRGGMGIVFEAIQETLGRNVAVKVLPREYLANPTYLKRFQREARSAAGLHHSNIVPIFGFGAQDGHHYFAMQFIRGQSLEAVLEEVRRLHRGNSPELEGERGSITCTVISSRSRFLGS
jgi:eukaryotic-like serine/threonine-protein kinase